MTITASALLAMIRKRHPSPRWIVAPEVGDGTGYKTKRHADALAMGVWPSDGHAIEGFEIKISRSDVNREIADPSKADGVGQYVDRWWLVVSGLDIIDGIAIPETWGILYPRSQVLREHRKAPKRKPKPFDRNFSAAIMRRIVEAWVPRDEHEQVKDNVREIVRGELESERDWKQSTMNMELGKLQQKVAAFKNESGIDLEAATPWNAGNIGRAVKAVLDARDASGANMRHQQPDPVELILSESKRLRAAAQRHSDAGQRMDALASIVDRLAKRYLDEAPVDPVEAAEWAKRRADDPVRIESDLDRIEL